MFKEIPNALKILLSDTQYDDLCFHVDENIIMEWNQIIQEYKEGGCTKEDYERNCTWGYGELMNLVDFNMSADAFMESEFVTSRINCKEEEKMKNTEKTVLVEIKTKTAEQWTTLCDKLQNSMDNENMFPHVECYSTYKEGETIPNVMNDKCYEDCEQEKSLGTNSVTKDKKYYLRKAEEGYNRCYAETQADLIAEFLAQETTNNKIEELANDLFLNSASVEETIGYYIETYNDEALKQWLENVSYITNDTEHRKTVTKVLEELYPTYIRIWYSWGYEEEPVYVSKEEARAKMIELALTEVKTCTAKNGLGAELVICASDVGKDCRIEYDNGTTFYKIVNG